jgi:ABC-type nitrate/sulfonate/bicarbonate transport system substrate-binding protein
VLVIASLSLTGCGSSKSGGAEGDKELDEINFVLDWTPNTNHIGVYVADKLGYYEEAGIKINIQQPPDDGAEALVASGKAQFGVSFQDTLSSLMEGKEKSMPITSVAAIIQHNTSGIMSSKENNITSPKDMEGHTYATWEWPIEQGIIKKVMEDDGGDFSKVTLIPQSVDDEVAALKAGEIDTIWVYYGWAGVAAEVKDYPINYFAFRDITPAFDYYSPVIIANDDFLADNPDTAKAFLAAVEQGYQYAIENPDKAADILVEANPEIDADLVKASQEYLADQYQAEASHWGVFDAARWNSFYEFINKEGLAEQEIPMDVGFTNDYLPGK